MYNVYDGGWRSYNDDPSGVVLAKEFGGSDSQLNLEDYSWEEINAIGKDISKNGNESDYYEQFEKFAEEGQTKTLMLGEGDDADRLFMRIIGINHDTIANSTDKAGLTFMAANAINNPYTFEGSDVAGTKNWALSALRNDMNTSGTENDQTIYDLLSAALNKVKISPLLVDKSYAKGYEDSTTYNSLEIKSSADYFFIPSFYEISNDSGMGLEGSKYKFINSDIWQSLAHKWREGEDIGPGPIMNAINWKGYLWFQNDEVGKKQCNEDIDTAFDKCEDEGGCVECTLNWYLWTRSVWPQLEGEYANAMSIYGDPENYYQIGSPMCVAPCFCLGRDEVPAPPEGSKSLLVHNDQLGDLMYAPVFPDGNPPAGIHFYTLSNNKYIEIKPSDSNVGLKMSDLAQAVKDKCLYYVNEGNNVLYAVRSVQVPWSTIATKNTEQYSVDQFDDTSGLRDVRTYEQTGYCDPDYWCGLDWRNDDDTGPSNNTTIYYNKNNIYSTGDDKVNTGVEVGDSAYSGSAFSEYDGFLTKLHVFGMWRLWSCVTLQKIEGEELSSNNAYFWYCGEGKWLTYGRGTNDSVVFSRAFH